MAASLNKLSPELKSMCFEVFVPDIVRIDDPCHLTKKYRECKANLRNLCLTSRAVRDAAQPLLFRNVVVADHEQLVYLFRALFINTKLRLAIRSFACLFDICYEDDKDEESKIAPVKFAQTENFAIFWNENLYQLCRAVYRIDLLNVGHLVTDDWVFRTIGLKLKPILNHTAAAAADSSFKNGPTNLDEWLHWSMENADNDSPLPGGMLQPGNVVPDVANADVQGLANSPSDLRQRLVATILILTQNVEDILLQAPLLAQAHNSSPMLRQIILRGFNQKGAGCPGKVLKKVKSVRLRGSILTEVFKPHGYKEQRGISPTGTFPFSVGQTRSLELFGDCGDWSTALDDFTVGRDPLNHPARVAGIERFKALTELKLLHSRTSAASLGKLLWHCRNLKHLTYTTRRREWHHADPPDNYSINSALLCAASQLEALHYEAIERPSHATGPDTDPRTITHKWDALFCLPEFVLLKHLTVDVCSLLGNDHETRQSRYIKSGPAGNQGSNHRLLWLLPLSVETVVFTERWSEEDLALYGSDPIALGNQDSVMNFQLAGLATDIELERKRGFGTRMFPHLKRIVYRMMHIQDRRGIDGDGEVNPTYYTLRPPMQRHMRTMCLPNLMTIFKKLGVEFSLECARVLRCEEEGEYHGLLARI
ncbi:hypothetical protein F5X99DRAFT_397569 [Biscogniauxia marginata]|nr:hypothetical protein F5X99DRAFT_397569 [Biscogniauxia marginata]